MLTLEKLNSFTLDAYRDLLAYFQRTHRYITFTEYADAPPHGRLILLRHDIDYSPQHALQLAQLEAQQGIKATYFLLLSSPFYNLLSPEHSAIPRRIAELGHEVGLHYDVPAILSASPDNPGALLEAQLRVLEQLCGAAVTAIAMHNPSSCGEDIFRSAPYINAYDDRFTRQMGYYSDSCMAWRDSFASNFTADTFPDRLQLLIHPCLWTAEALSRAEKLERILDATRTEAQCGCEQVRAIWRDHAGVAEHDRRESLAAAQASESGASLYQSAS